MKQDWKHVYQSEMEDQKKIMKEKDDFPYGKHKE